MIDENWWNLLVKKRQEESIGLIKVKNIISRDLYPDNAHFIYELLQNAEDTGANKVSFQLYDDKLIFKHNGKRLFTPKDIEAITDINNFDSHTEKKDRFNIDTIGKFGIGFKAVFAYTDTPKIYSGDFSFEINNLVVPNKIDKISKNDNETVMIFSFNNSDKSKEIAFYEIKRGLSNIQDNTLLFLTNINTIEYTYSNYTNKITREDIDSFKVSILNNSTNKTSKWLRFKKYLPTSDTLFVSTAFKLEYDQKEKKDFIVPTNGEVFIYFPAEKESSNLKFHIHAPFSSTVARDSIKDIEENYKLVDLLSELIAESLEYIKEKGLLDFSFISCLPIDDDNLPEFYKTIQKKLIYSFNNYPYMVTDTNSFQPANKCYKSSAEIKKIVDIKFLKLLLGINEKDDIYWAKNARQKNSREDKFLNSLEIEDLQDDDFIEYLSYYIKYFKYLEDNNIKTSIKVVFEYLNSKSDKWFGNLYSYLYKNIWQDLSVLNKIIRLSNNNLNIHGENCYFSDNESSEYKIVKKETYTSNNKDVNKKAKLFLEYLGIKEIGEKEKIEIILKNKYNWNSKKLDFSLKEHLKDIKLFLEYFKNSGDITIFQNKKFLLNNEEILQRANQLIIDKPYIDTKMKLLLDKNYFDSINNNWSSYFQKYLISNEYTQLDDKKIFIDFLKKLGILYKLEIVGCALNKNEDYEYLIKDYYTNKEMNKTKVEKNWSIEKLDNLLNYKSIEISLLLWNTMKEANNEVFKAKYRPNAQCEIREADSTLIQCLKKYPWIPDTKGKFYLPQDISIEMLPKEFVYDDRNGWLSAIGFGENIKKSQKEYQEANKIIKEKTGLSLDILEEVKKLEITEGELKEFFKQKKEQKLKDSLRKNQGSGDSPEIIQARNNETLITDEEKYQKNVYKENQQNPNKIITRETSFKTQDYKEIQKIESFLYKEYEGHCQICGDTFAYKDKNTFITKSLNIGKNRDINRKGNTICLCCKHHEIFDLKLQKNLFIENLNNSIDINDIKKEFVFESFVSKEDNNEINDSFYRLNENDGFNRDVYFLPVKIFNKVEYIKFTEAHILEFITVWNNN